MRIARIRDTDGGTWIARITSDDGVEPLFAAPERFGTDALRDALVDGLDLRSVEAVAGAFALADVRLLSPVSAPSKIVAIGLNYADHVRESGMDMPTAPVVFVKTPNSLCGPDDDVVYRRADSTEVDYEVELAAVIGRRARDVSEAEALTYVLGYTVCNDVSARDAQFADSQWIRGKSFDTFCPLGPWIVTTDELPDPQSLGIRCRVNGTTLQDSTTKEMVFGVAQLVSYLSRYMTLEPGDVIATGTPFGVGFARDPKVFLLDGDVVECEIDGIGRLRNTVRAT